MALDVKRFGVVFLLIAITLIGFAKSEPHITEETKHTILAPTTALSSALSTLRNMIFRRGESNLGESRTFGKIRRLQMAMIPLVFKFGVLSTLIFVLVALGVKTVFLLKTLLILNIIGLVAKFFIWKSSTSISSNNNHAVTYAHWIPPPPPIFPNHQKQLDKEVHLHIHNDDKANAHGNYQGSWEAQNHNEHFAEPYGAYSNDAVSYSSPPVATVRRRNFKRYPNNFKIENLK